MNIILRDDQAQMKAGIYDKWRGGDQNVLGVLSTGGGKSIIVSDIALDIDRARQTQAIIAHRNELVGQMSMHVADRGIYHRIIAPKNVVASIVKKHRKKYNRSFVSPSGLAAVVGVDTLCARADEMKPWAEQVAHWTIDEAHHVLRNNKWGTAVKMFPRARGLGVTATPWRTAGEGLGRHADGVFDSMVLGIEMRQLIGIGALSDYEIVCPESDLHVDDKDVGATTGDWSPVKLRKAARQSHIVGDVVKAYCRYAFGRRAIVFSTDVETAGEQAAQFNAAGIRAAAVSANTNPVVREKFIEEFKEGKLTVLINVDLFDEGFDVPACDVVIMTRPTASLGKYRQMVGRALRYVPGKVALIIDHVSNVVRHGLPDKYVAWSLDRRDKRGKQEKDPHEMPLTNCKTCTKPYEKFRVACPYCGAEPPLPAPQDRTLEMVQGDLTLLTREILEKMRQSQILEAPGDMARRITEQVGQLAGAGALNRQLEKFAARERLKDAMAMWAGIEKFNGLTDREIQRKFYYLAGCDVMTAFADKTRAEFDELTQRIEGWMK